MSDALTSDLDTVVTHAGARALEHYGQVLTLREQRMMLARIERGQCALLREPCERRDKLPMYLVAWPNAGTAIPVIVNPRRKRVVTVLAMDCTEVRWRFEKLFGSAA